MYRGMCEENVKMYRENAICKQGIGEGFLEHLRLPEASGERHGTVHSFVPSEGLWP